MNNVNAALRSVFNDLVEKRLWPVAAALGIALIAIPVLLSKSAANEPAATPAPAVAPATGSGGAQSAFQPVVNTEGKKSSEIRKNLKGFRSKDPFKVQGLTTGGGSGTDTGTVSVGGDTSTGGGGSDTGSVTAPDNTSGSGDQSQGTSGSGDQSQGTSGTGTGSPTLTYYQYTVDVRFGVGSELDKKRLENFRALPSSENPVVVFMGVKTDGETAVFLVSAASSTTGEGDCEPDDTCVFLYMKAGQQQSFEAVDGNDQVVTYVLKMLDVNVEKTEAPQASSSKSERRAARRAAREQRNAFERRIQAVGF